MYKTEISAIKNHAEPESSGNGNYHQKTVAELLVDAEVNALKENSTSEETSAAIIRFANLTDALDPVLRKVAQSDLINKLKSTGSGYSHLPGVGHQGVERIDLG